MDRKTSLAMILCVLIYLGWQKLYLEPRFHPENPAPIQNTSPTSQSASLDQTVQTHAAQSVTPPKTVRPSQKLSVETSTGETILNDTGPVLSDWTLKSYKTGMASSAPFVDLKTVTHQNGEIQLAFEDPQYSYINDVQGELIARADGISWKYEDERVKLTREISRSSSKPYLELQVQAEFKGKHPNFAFVSIASQGVDKDPEAQDRQLIYWTNQSIERAPIKESMSQLEIPTPVKYIGATNRYFLLAVVAQGPMQGNGLIQPLGVNAGRISMVYPISGNSISIPLRVYFGPKELELLRQVEPTLDHAVDFGWFTLFAYPLLKVLKYLYQFFHNYGVAIIVLTLLLKIALYPLTYKSMKSMKKMAKLQPQLQKMREKYKDDKEALNREMLSMMKNHGYNPAAGCLPMVAQMPIFFALYRVLYNAIELYHAPFAGWIQDLSSRDPYFVTPVLLSLTMFIQQKLTPNTATDPAQARMMQLMPLIFGAFMLYLPSGLTIYMLVNALASIAQQLILNKKLDGKPAR